MNNSKLEIESFSLEEPQRDRSPELREREGQLVRIIETLKGVAESKLWSSLKTQVFDGVVGKLERDLLFEARKDSPDQLAMARLNGQLMWAKKYADLDKLANDFRLELKQIRIVLYGKTQEKPESSESYRRNPRGFISS